MGNGQNRNRRGGARTRHGPHRGGASAGDRRNATQLVPPAHVASAEATAAASTEVDEVDIEANAEREDTSALDTEGESPFVRADEPSAPAEPTADEVVASPAALAAETPAAPDAPAIPAAAEAPETQAAPEAAEAPEASEAPVAQDEPPEAERRAPRGRFERFYAPGQGPRAEQQPGAAANGAGHAAGHATGHGASNTASRESHPAAHATPPIQATRHVHAAVPPEASTEDDEDETEATLDLPREDVRGPVGALIDDLHELFKQDRTAASQGGNSRCGICYFHFPLGELIYREAEGFYVCQQCERSLGSARVSMVRRQQRQ